MNDPVVIVGAGQAGVATAFKLRALGHKGDITLVSAEPETPYHRPPLSKKFLTGTATAERLHIRHIDLYANERIRLLKGRSALSIDRASRHVHLSDGQVLEFGALVLCTGAQPRRLESSHGGDGTNAYGFRTLEDAERLRSALMPGQSLLLVGAGYVGLELAAVARTLGMRVTIIERDRQVLGRVAAEPTAEWFRNLHEAHGVAIRTGVSIADVEYQDGRVRKVRLTDRSEVAVDVLVFGIGVAPETALASAAGLLADNGILVDERGRTQDPAIYAAGDCANFARHDKRIRLESVQNAVDTAELVAKSICGMSVDGFPTPWFWSEQYTTKLQIAGLNTGYTHVIVRQASEMSLSVWYYEQDSLLAVDAINDPKAFMTARQWLEAGRSPAPDDIGNPELPLSVVRTQSAAETTH